MKHICKRDLLRNAAKSLDNEPTIVTKYGNPDYFIGKVNTVSNLNQTLDTLNSFKSSLSYSSQNFMSSSVVGGGGGSGNPINVGVEVQDVFVTDNQPIVQKGGDILYGKKTHTHKK